MGLEQIQVELQEVLGNDNTWSNLVSDLSQIDMDLEYNELSHIRFRFHFHVPIFVSRQYMRHRNQSPNEMSGRYRTMPNDFLYLPQEVVDIYDKAQRKDWREKASGEFLSGVMPPENIAKEWAEKHEEIYSWYKGQLQFLRFSEKEGLITNAEYKRAREVFRGILGTSFFTDIVATWDLNNLIKFLVLRLDPHAQPEIQEQARQILDQLKESNKIPQVLEFFNF